MESNESTVKIDISPLTSFKPAIDIHAKIRTGEKGQYETALKNYGLETTQEGVATWGFKINVANDEVGTKVVELLGGLKDTFLGSNESFQERVNKGLKVDIYYKDKAVHVCNHLTGQLAEEKLSHLGKIDLTNLHYKGQMDLLIGTGFDPTKLLSSSVSEILDMATLFTIKGDGHFVNIGEAISVVKPIILESEKIKEKLKLKIVSLLQLFTAMKEAEFDFNYDPITIRSTVSEVLKVSDGDDNVGKGLANQQEGVKTSYLPMAKGFLPMVFQFCPKELLTNVSFDDFELFLIVPKAYYVANFGLVINGLTDFIKNNIFNE